MELFEIQGLKSNFRMYNPCQNNLKKVSRRSFLLWPSIHTTLQETSNQSLFPLPCPHEQCWSEALNKRLEENRVDHVLAAMTTTDWTAAGTNLIKRGESWCEICDIFKTSGKDCRFLMNKASYKSVFLSFIFQICFKHTKLLFKRNCTLVTGSLHVGWNIFFPLMN